ncbi:MAG: hypothetical protein CSB55_02205 [Candidatus Cloacimonadota bacterium]|nr:MAG: hypothetical protein CSB55_02205 [Candidatus Cloacimonadota bacterium]
MFAINFKNAIKAFILLFFLILICPVFGETYLQSINFPGTVVYKKQNFHLPITHRGINFVRGSSWFVNKMNIKREIEFDTEHKTASFKIQFGGLDIAPPRYVSMEKMLDQETSVVFENLLREKMLEFIRNPDRNSGTGLFGKEFEIPLPKIALPKTLKRLMGDKAARLSVDGTQKLTVSAIAKTQKGIQIGESGASTSLTPKMQQELNLRLRGKIGQKIHVNITHRTSSEQTFDEPSKVEIRYEGDEDEIIQSIEAGNISLSLSGSKYIAYSANSEGLFGVKSALKVGPLDITLIAGTEEGEKNSATYKGNSKVDSSFVKSQKYIRRQFFFIDDPRNLFVIYSNEGNDNPSTPPNGWNDNAFLIEDNALVLKSQATLPEPNSIKVWRDNKNGTDNLGTVQGTDINNPGGEIFEFDLLEENIDYIFWDDSKTIIEFLNRQDADCVIGITYESLAEQVGDLDSSVKKMRILYQRSADGNAPTEETRKYFSANFYSLGGKGFRNDTFSMKTVWYDESDEMQENLSDSLSYDNGFSTFNDWLNLDTSGDGEINGNDVTVNLAMGILFVPLLRPFSIIGDDKIYDNSNINKTSSVQIDNEIGFSVVGSMSNETINLDGLNILKGSVKVKLGDGTVLKENTDYIVDYDFGQITLLNEQAKGGDANITVDYEYLPLFAIDSKTLMGVRADYNITDEIKLGGTVVYQSEKVADKRPKIGNENRSQIMADLDGQVVVNPPFMTAAVDAIPLVETDEESEISLSGEIAVNIPTIYGDPDKKDDPEAYIDDMESTLELFPFGISRKTWSYASLPKNNFYPKAKLWYYNPEDIKKNKVYDPATLDDDERNENVAIMRMKFMPENLGQGHSEATKNWNGVMKYIGASNDFSEKKYIEIMVKTHKGAMSSETLSSPVIMHVDLGTISEDFYTINGGEGVLNSEDGVLDTEESSLDGVLNAGEDIGLDMMTDEEEQLYGLNPEYDNYESDESENEYPWINLTQNNLVLDTEDLNSSGSLDMTNSYSQFTVNLSGDKYLVSEISSSGYRIYRLPFRASEFTNFSDSGLDPSLESVRYLRMWFEVEEECFVDIAEADIVGNKWDDQPVKDADGNIISIYDLESNNEYISGEIIDSEKNNHYFPPKGTYETDTDGTKSMEQAFELNISNLQSGHTGGVRHKFTDKTDLLSWGELRFWIYAEDDRFEPFNDSLNVFVRLGADSLNFYQAEMTVKPSQWEQQMSESNWIDDFIVKFSDLAILKQRFEEDELQDTYKNGKIKYKIVGNPTLSNIRQMYLGVLNPNPVKAFTGKVYFDDIRVADPYTDSGIAAQSELKLKFADFSQHTFNFEWKTPNFRTIKARSKNSGSSSQTESENFTVNNKINLNKFTSSDWGLKLPLTLYYKNSKSTPRFVSNSDILLEEIQDKEERERNITRTETRKAALNFSIGKTPKNTFMKYTLKNISTNSSVSHTVSNKPTARDTTVQVSQKVSYNVSLPKDSISFKLFKNYRFYYMPYKFSNSITFTGKYPKSWKWIKKDKIWQYKTDGRSNTDEEKIAHSHSVDWAFFSDFTSRYEISINRDRRYPVDLHGVNIGHEMKRNQIFSLDYSPSFTEDFIGITAGANVNFADNVSATKSNDDSLYFKHSGQVPRTVKAGIVLKNKDWLLKLADMFGTVKEVELDVDQSVFEDDLNKFKDKINEDKNNDKDKDFFEGNDKDKDEFSFGNDPKEKTKNSYDLNKNNFEGLAVEEKMERLKKMNKKRTRKEKEKEKAEEENQEKDKKDFNIFKEMIGYIARIENIKIDYMNTYRTSYNNLRQMPPFEYQLSIPYSLPEEDLSGKSDTDDISLSTSYPVFSFLSTSWKYSYKDGKTYTYNKNGKTAKEDITTVFPDVTVNMSGLEKLIGMDKILISSRLSSHYAVTYREDGNIGEDPSKKMSVIAFEPLVSWNSNWAYNISSAVSYSMADKNLKTFQLENVKNTDDETGRLNISIEHVLQMSKGIKLPFMKRVIKLKNDFSTSVSYSMEKNKSVMTDATSKKVNNDTDTNTFTVGGSYNFHRDVKGGLNFEHKVQNNNKADTSITTQSYSVWVEISF